MSNRLVMFTTAVMGLVSGFAGTLLSGSVLPDLGKVTHGGPPSQDTTRMPIVNTHADLTAWINDSREQRLTALEAKMRATESRPQPAGGDGEPESTEGVENLDFAAAREDALERWSARVADHEAEPLDPAWSTAMAASFEKDVGGLSESGHFELVAVSCKSKTCSATVQWSDYGQALRGYASLLHHSYEKPCAREILLPEPENRDAPYQATVFYDCSVK